MIFLEGFFYGWTGLVWIISFSSAINGILVSVVMKYADNVKKSYCQSMALGGTAIISVFTGDAKGSILLFIGVGLVISSILLYSLFPPTQKSDCPCAKDITDEKLIQSHNLTDDQIQRQKKESLTLA